MQPPPQPDVTQRHVLPGNNGATSEPVAQKAPLAEQATIVQPAPQSVPASPVASGTRTWCEAPPPSFRPDTELELPSRIRSRPPDEQGEQEA